MIILREIRISAKLASYCQFKIWLNKLPLIRELNDIIKNKIKYFQFNIIIEFSHNLKIYLHPFSL